MERQNAELKQNHLGPTTTTVSASLDPHSESGQEGRVGGGAVRHDDNENEDNQGNQTVFILLLD